MPTTTTNFKLPIALGTDNYNHLTIDNEAFKKIDNQMFKNQNSAIQDVQETTSGTVHALTTTIPTASVFKFTATSDFRSGDTFTMNGASIIARLSNGQTLPDYAYRIGNNVIFVQSGGILTFLTPASLTLLDAYPVGSIYITASSMSPANLFGGTWVAIKDRFLIGASENYPAASTGGEATHTLSVKEMPNHKHTMEGYATHVGTGDKYYSTVQAPVNYGTAQTSEVGGGLPHNNIPPYLAVFIWQRTA